VDGSIQLEQAIFSVKSPDSDVDSEECPGPRKCQRLRRNCFPNQAAPDAFLSMEKKQQAVALDIFVNLSPEHVQECLDQIMCAEDSDSDSDSDESDHWHDRDVLRVNSVRVVDRKAIEFLHIKDFVGKESECYRNKDDLVS
jgi:hypothetical protein